MKTIRIIKIIIAKVKINYFMVFTEFNWQGVTEMDCTGTIYFYKGVKRRKFICSQYMS